jgi:hypothetical protein
MCIGSARTQFNRRRWLRFWEAWSLVNWVNWRTSFGYQRWEKETSGNADFRHWNSGQDCLVTRFLNQRNIRTNEQRTGLRTGDSKEMRKFAMLAKGVNLSQKVRRTDSKLVCFYNFGTLKRHSRVLEALVKFYYIVESEMLKIHSEIFPYLH